MAEPKKEVISKLKLFLLAFTAGSLLFLSFFFTLTGNLFFSDSFQESAFDRLGIYETIADMTIKPALDFTEKLPQPTNEAVSSPNESSASSILPVNQDSNSQVRLQSFLRKNLDRKMVKSNLKSLTEGLTAYLRGETRRLPDLQLAGSSTFQRINLSVLILYFGERQITDILLLAGLAQFLLAHLQIFFLLLYLSIFMVMLNTPPDKFYYWMNRTVSAYCLLNFSAAFLIQLLVRVLMPFLSNKVLAGFPAMAGALPGYAGLFFDTLTFWMLLSGTLLYASVLILRFLIEKRNPVSSFPHAQNRLIAPVFSIIIFVLLGFVLLYQVKMAASDFDNRELRQAFTILSGNDSTSGVIYARKDLIYLLEVHIIDSSSKKPVPGLNVRVIKKSGTQSLPDSGTKLCNIAAEKKANKKTDIGSECRLLTDLNGSADFFLGKGSYSLVLESAGAHSSAGRSAAARSGTAEPAELTKINTDSVPNACDFELSLAGKSALTIESEKTSGGFVLKSASYQFVP